MMLDGTLNITLENSLISTIFSGVTEQSFESLNEFSFENFFSPLSPGEISALAQCIQAKSISIDLSSLLENFAAWIGRLQNNQALTDDLTEDVPHESFWGLEQDLILNNMSKPNNSLTVGYAIAGINIEDSLLSYSIDP